MGTLEALVGAAVEQVALSPDGLPAADLWGSLAEAADEAGVALSASAARAAVWRRLLAEPGVRARGAGRDEGGATGRSLQPGADAELASPEAAAAAGVVLAACKELQEAAVGLFDSRLTRFAISDAQRKALAAVGAAGRRGALQSALAQRLGVENRNFFYIVKVLEERGLVTKRPVVVKRDQRGQGFVGSFVQTNILHLARFAPQDLARGAKLTDGLAMAHGGMPPPGAGPGLSPTSSSAAAAAGGGPGGPPGQLGDAELSVLDDAAHFRRICQQLAACPGQQANESELKNVLGFRGQRGHKLWRRIKPALAKRGNVEEFLARTDRDRAVRCIKLVKPYREEEGESSSEDEAEAEAGAGAPPLGRQLAERSVDRQLLHALVQAGDSGATSSALSSGLGLNMKRNEQRLRELEARWGVQRQTVTQGRMMSSRYTAPEALLRALEASIAPLQPEGGWLATVCDAIEAGLDQGEAFPWPPTAPAASASQAPTPAQAQTAAPGEPQQQQQPQAALAVPTPAGAEFLPPLGAGSQQAALAAAAAAAGGLPGLPSATPSPAAAAAGGGETPLDPRHLPPLPPRAQAAAGGEGAGGTAKYTLTAERRYAQVLDRLSRRGFLLASEMPHFLRECARAEGEARPTKPDRKTCDRIVERGQKEGRFQVITITFPSSKYGGLSQRTHSVLAAPGQQAQGEAFVERVFQHFQSFKRRVHASNTVHELAVREELAGKELPVVALGTLRAAAGGGGEGVGEGAATVMGGAILALMVAAGYSQHRMQRLRIVHEVACALAGLPTSDPGQAGPPPGWRSPALDALGGGQVFVVTAVPGAVPGARSRLDIQQADLAQDEGMARRVVTPRDIWNTLSVRQFAVAIGTQADPAQLDRLAASGASVGQLSGEDAAALWGADRGPEHMRAHSRLMLLLDLAHRMGLLSSVMPVGSAGGQQSIGGAASCSTFAVRPQLVLQEPPAAAQAAAGVASAPPATARDITSFDLTAPGALAAYWAHLQFLATRLGSGRAVGAGDPLGPCFPFDRAPEAGVERAFAHRKAVTPDQMRTLAAYLAGEDSLRMGPARCREVASQLGLPYEAVLTFIQENYRPTQRLGRLATGAAARVGGRSARSNEVGPDATALERRRAAQRRYYERTRQRRAAERALLATLPAASAAAAAAAAGAEMPDAVLHPTGRAGRRARKRKGGEGAQPAAEEEREWEAEEGGAAGLVDPSALLPRPQAAPLRKKRWHKWEDRELVTAWLGWLASNGAERMLLWRVVPGRPQGLKHHTLKRRLTALQTHAELGPALEEARGGALRLHALLLQHRVAAAAAAEAGARQEKAGEAEGESQQPAEQQAGDKRGAGSPAAEDARAAKRARGGDAQPAAEAAQPAGEESGEAADVQPAGVDAAEAARLLRAALPRDLQRLLASGRLQEGTALLARLAQLAERVVGAAPMQYAEGWQPKGASPKGARRRPGPKPLSEAQRRVQRPGSTLVAARPHTLLRRWAAALRGAGGRAAEGGEDGSAAAAAPGPEITAAIALAESLLYLGAETGILGAGCETALSGRFRATDIWRAFEVLQRQGALAPRKGGRSDFQLTDRWRAQLQALAFAPSLFREAAALDATLHLHRKLDISAAAPTSDDGRGAGSDALRSPAAHAQPGPGEHLTGGAVAELLGRMAAGRLVLKPHRVRVVPRLSEEAAAAAEEGEAAAAAAQHTAPLDFAVPVRAVMAAPQHAALAGGGSEGSAAGGGGGGTAAAALAEEQQRQEESGGEGGGEAAEAGARASGGDAALAALRFTCQEHLLFQPSLVGSDAGVRSTAEVACRSAAAAAGIASAVVDAALAALRAAGGAGCTRRQLAAALAAAGGGAAAAGALLPQLLLHGLARSVAGFDGRRYAATEHSQHLLAFPHLPLPPAADGGEAAEGEARLESWRASLAEEVQRLAAAQGLPEPEGGAPALQPSLDVPLRPWADHHGRLNRRLWEALARKALAAVARLPGMPEDLLLQELSVLAPQHARELLRVLAHAGLLRLQALPCSAGTGGAPGSPTSVLAACFAPTAASLAGSGAHGGEQQAGAGEAGAGEASSDGDDATGGEGGCGEAAHRPRHQRFYFASPGAVFSAPRVLPPAVLLPLEAPGGGGAGVEAV